MFKAGDKNNNSTEMQKVKTRFDYFNEMRIEMQENLGRELTEDELHSCFMYSVLKEDFVNHEINTLGKMPNFDHDHHPEGGCSI